MKGKLLTGVQFVILAIFFYRRNLFANNILSLTTLFIGLTLGIWSLWTMRRHFSAFPELTDNAMLLVSGPYAFTRNPMYLSLIIILLPLVFRPFDVFLLICYGALIVVLKEKIDIEEEQLMAKFSDYDKYRKKVKKLIPYIF